KHDAPDLKYEFNMKKLRKTKTEEKNTLPTKEGKCQVGGRHTPAYHAHSTPVYNPLMRLSVLYQFFISGCLSF
uniref:Uncharacterized protein n=1 Tax=Hippocampus comes TaxID=109280 RepID=A0A3Q2XC28_HIPCM